MIREARPGDAEGIARVHVRAWEAAYKDLLREEVIRDRAAIRRRWWRSYLGQPHEGEHVLVSATERGITGFATARPSPDEDAEPDQAEVAGLYIEPAAWREGIGSALLEALLERLRRESFNCATLWVLAGSDRARHFYESRGWKLDGAERVDPQRGAAELRYRIRL